MLLSLKMNFIGFLEKMLSGSRTSDLIARTCLREASVDVLMNIHIHIESVGNAANYSESTFLVKIDVDESCLAF